MSFKGASTSQVIGARNEMMMDDYDGQMIFGDLVGLKLPAIRLTCEEKPRKNLTQETFPDRGSNPGPLRDKRACYHLLHRGGLHSSSYPIVLTRQGGPRSRPYTSRKFLGFSRESNPGPLGWQS